MSCPSTKTTRLAKNYQIFFSPLVATNYESCLRDATLAQQSNRLDTVWPPGRSGHKRVGDRTVTLSLGFVNDERLRERDLLAHVQAVRLKPGPKSPCSGPKPSRGDEGHRAPELL